MTGRDPTLWRSELTLTDPSNEQDLNDLVDGCQVIGTDADPWADWHPRSVVSVCDALVAACHVDARERRREADDATLRLTDSRLRLDCYRRLLGKSERAVMLSEVSLADAAPHVVKTDPDRVRFDNAFGALNLVLTLRDDLSDLVARWTATVRNLELLVVAATTGADLADDRLRYVRRCVLVRTMHLPLVADDD